MVFFSHSGQDTQAQKEQGLNGLTVEKPHIMNSFHWRWRWRWFVQNFLGFLKPFSHCCFTSFFQSKGKKRSPHRLTLPQLPLCAVKVKVHVETLHKFCDRVFVRVRLLQEEKNKTNVTIHGLMSSQRASPDKLLCFYLLNDFHQVLQHLPSLSYVFVGDDCSREVSQDVWAHCLDGVQVPEEKKQRKKITLSSSQNQVRTHLILQFNSAEEKPSDRKRVSHSYTVCPWWTKRIQSERAVYFLPTQEVTVLPELTSQ